MKKLLFFTAVTGWTLGLVVHLLSLASFDVTDKIPFVWILHIGIFVVWVPTVIDLNNNQELQEFKRAKMLTRTKPFSFFKIIFKTTPNWLIIIAIGCFLYAFVNFILFMALQTGTPSIKNGQYILQNHGQLITTLTKEEYHSYRANEVRGFSGHWLAFYGMAMAVLFPFKKSIKREQSSTLKKQPAANINN